MTTDQLPEGTTGVLLAALRVFDHTSIETIRRIRAGRMYSQRMTISVADANRLLAAIDSSCPGLVDQYYDFRLQKSGRKS